MASAIVSFLRRSFAASTVRTNAAEIPDGLSLAPFRCEFSIAAVIAAFFFSRVTAEAFRASALEEMVFFLPSPALDTFLRAFMVCLPPVLIEVLPSMPLRRPDTSSTTLFSTPASVTPTSTASPPRSGSASNTPAQAGPRKRPPSVRRQSPPGQLIPIPAGQCLPTLMITVASLYQGILFETLDQFQACRTAREEGIDRGKNSPPASYSRILRSRRTIERCVDRRPGRSLPDNVAMTRH